MKAKEIAKKYNNSPTKDTLAEISMMFYDDLYHLIDVRKAKCNSAVLAIFTELNQKWEAFSRLSPGIKEDGFQIIFETLFPDVFKMWKQGK